MTISYPAFKSSRLKACWNNDGTILIIRGVNRFKVRLTKPAKKNDMYRSKDYASVKLQPLEIEQILSTGEFHYEGSRPGMLHFPEKIDVTTKRGIVSIKVISFYGMPKNNGEVDVISMVSMRKTTLATIQEACRRVWKKQRTGIRPLIGLNSKAGSFDGMAGTLDQDKKNEEQRALVKEILGGKNG